MNDRRPALILALLISLGILVLFGMTWANYQYAEQYPGGNDFLPRWMGTRLYLTRGWSPYSQQTTDEIQRMIFGRTAQEGEDLNLFVYPFYSVFMFAPFAMVSEYVLARALWMTFLEAVLAILAIQSLRLSRWKIPIWMLVLLMLFSALWYHGFRPVINGNASVVCALLIVLAFTAIKSDHDVLAGVLLAFSSIKPQMVILLFGFVFLWAISKSRWQIVWSTLASLVFLFVVTSLMMPRWIIPNLQQVLTYPLYTLPGSPGAIFSQWLPGVGRQMGWALTTLMIGMLVVEWRVALKRDFAWFLWTASLTLTITHFIGIRTATENYIGMFPGLLLIFVNWDERWRNGGRWMVLLSMGALFFGLWELFLRTIIPGDQPIQNPVMFFPLPGFILLGLYTVRWWAINPPRVFADELRHSRNLGL